MTTKHVAAEQRTLRLMGEFGLKDGKWVFHWNTRKSQMGRCQYPHLGKPGRIELSWYFVLMNDAEAIEDTIRHEIAHALAGRNAHHGPLWVKMCAITGANPTRCGDKPMPEGRWQAQCGGCGRKFNRHRRPKSLTGWHCIACGPGKGSITYAACFGHQKPTGTKQRLMLG